MSISGIANNSPSITCNPTTGLFRAFDTLICIVNLNVGRDPSKCISQSYLASDSGFFFSKKVSSICVSCMEYPLRNIGLEQCLKS